MIKVIEYNNGYIAADIILLLGYFDGMHIGHQKLLEVARAKQAETGYKIAIMTFLGSKEEEVIYTFSERLYSFEQLQIEYCIVVNFDNTFRRQSGEEFIDKLTQICNLKGVICGSDFTFGQGAMSDVQALNKICKRYNIFSIVVDLCMDSNRKDEHFQNKISTSLIKEKLRSGDLSEIERLLGSKYFILGNVVKGKQIARKINFPTANINLEPQKALLKSGVYAVHVAYKGKKYKGIANLGEKPTLYDNTKLLEVHIFDFHRNIYQEQVVVFFDRFIRNIQKFENIQQLQNQIKKDIEQI